MRALQSVAIATLSIAIPIAAEAQSTPAQPSTVTAGGTTGSGTTTGTTSPGTGGNPPTTGPYVARDITTSSSSPSSLSDTVLSGLHFWRANIGVALRW